MWISAFILMLSLSQPKVLLEEPAAPTPPPLTGSPAEQCVAGEEQKRFDEAAEACLKAVEAEPENTALIRKAADVLFQADRGVESARCWKLVLDQEGWSCDAALKRANALWRGEKKQEAHAAFAECRMKCTESSEAAFEELRFLEDFGLWKDALHRAEGAVTEFPDDCRISELHAVAADQLGAWDIAATAISKALEKGCPPFRWAKLGEIPHHLDQPAYAPFLEAKQIVRGLADLSEAECSERLLLLKNRMNSEASGAVLDTLLHRKRSKTRLIALGLISELGPRAGEIWKTLLASEDFILRKYTLRTIRNIRDPAFIPLLQDHLEREKSPGNLDLTRMVLGELLYGQGKRDEAIQQFKAVGRDGYLFQPVQLLLAKWAREEGSDAAEMTYLEEAQAADPSAFLQVERLEELQAKLSLKAKDKITAEEKGKKPTREKRMQNTSIEESPPNSE